MVKSFTFLILSFFIISCGGIKTKHLNNSYIQIPLDDSFFIKNYKSKYKLVKFSSENYESIYLESFYTDYSGKFFNSKSGANSFIGAFKFYKNGAVNRFSLDKRKLNNLSILNPTKKGYRGVYYLKNGKQMISIVLPVTQNRKNYGVKDYEFSFKGDTLTIKEKNSNYKYIYLKQKLSKENLKFRADW
jgi:hypothetical protein